LSSLYPDRNRNIRKKPIANGMDNGCSPKKGTINHNQSFVKTNPFHIVEIESNIKPIKNSENFIF